MAAKTLENRINTESFSHASGSVPGIGKPEPLKHRFFPRKWECSLEKKTKKQIDKLFPTQVGVFLMILIFSAKTRPFSHASGSVPILQHALSIVLLFFPRKWECSYCERWNCCVKNLFPTWVQYEKGAAAKKISLDDCEEYIVE